MTRDEFVELLYVTCGKQYLATANPADLLTEYDRLVAENEELRMRRMETVAMSDQLQAENERLREMAVRSVPPRWGDGDDSANVVKACKTIIKATENNWAFQGDEMDWMLRTYKAFKVNEQAWLSWIVDSTANNTPDTPRED